MIIAIDPGNKISAGVMMDYQKTIWRSWRLENSAMRNELWLLSGQYNAASLVIGHTPQMSGNTKYDCQKYNSKTFVPNQVVLTAIEVGRFFEFWERFGATPAILLSQIKVKKHLLGRSTGTDADITQAILDIFGGTQDKVIGSKTSPGPLYGIKKDRWAAIALAITYQETI